MMSFESLAGGYERKRKKRFSLESFRNFVARRESIPSLEKLSQDSEHQEHVSNIAFTLLEKEPKVQEQLKQTVQEALQHDQLQWQKLTRKQQQSILAGNFTIGVESSNTASQDTVTVYPEGNITEKISLNAALTKTVSATLG